MANYGIIVDILTNEVQLKETPQEHGGHLIWTQTIAPEITDESFQIYESQSTGTVVGTVDCTDPDVTFEITSGNTGNAFSINSSSGIITTAAVLDYETLSGYSLGIKVTSNQSPSLTDTAIATITVLKVYTKCSDCTISFSATTLDNVVGYLVVGVVTAASGTISDYAIEWRNGSTTGSTVFISGAGSDPNIQALHPLNYEPVNAGTLYAVLRYITIDGVDYSAYPYSDYGLYSPDLATCLGNRTVVAMSCTNGTTGTTYGHTIQYANTSMPSTVANRSMTYTLNEDGSSRIIAWTFSGYYVADRLKISYVTGSTLEEQLIEDWVIGQDCTGYTYNSLPKLYDTDSLKSSFSLTGFTYQSGDYLRFDVYPSYWVSGYTDTNWYLQIKCFDDEYAFDTAFFPSNDYCLVDTGDTMSLTWNATNCTYDLSVHTLSGFTSAQWTTSDVYRYFQSGIYVNGDFDTDTTISLANYSGVSYTWADSRSWGSYSVMNGQMTIGITGSTHQFVYDFTDETDYLHYKNGYATLTGGTAWSAWTADATQYRHYQVFYLSERISLTSGDTTTHIYPWINRESTFDFDDTNYKITITMAPQVNEYVPIGDCDRAGTDINGYVNNGNAWYSGVTQNHTTIWKVQYPFCMFDPYTRSVSQTTDYTYYTGLGVPTGTTHSSLSLGPRFHVAAGNTWMIYKNYLRVKITNTSDPTNNYEVYNKLNSDGSVNADWTLIKKVGT